MPFANSYYSNKESSLYKFPRFYSCLQTGKNWSVRGCSGWPGISCYLVPFHMMPSHIVFMLVYFLICLFLA